MWSHRFKTTDAGDAAGRAGRRRTRRSQGGYMILDATVGTGLMAGLILLMTQASAMTHRQLDRLEDSLRATHFAELCLTALQADDLGELRGALLITPTADHASQADATQATQANHANQAPTWRYEIIQGDQPAKGLVWVRVTATVGDAEARLVGLVSRDALPRSAKGDAAGHQGAGP